MLDLFVAIFYLALLLQYNVELTIIGVAFSLLSLGMYLGTRRHLTDLSMRIQQDVGKEYGTAINGLGMIESLKANGDEQDFFAKWAGYHVKVLAAQQEQALWSLRVNMLPTLFGGLNTALIMAVGGFSIMDGLLTAGMFTAFQTLMGGFQTPFNKLIGLGTSLQTTEMQLQRLNDVERYQPDTLNYPETEGTGFSGVRLSGDLELRDVTFGFSPLSPPLIEDFSLHIGKGRWVALVGASGSGKSTIAKVVTGLYEEWSGEVLLDGVRRRDIPRRAVVASLAAVDQDIFLLSGTVRENIALFDTSVSRADVMQAAKDACIHDDIMNLEGSYEYQVSEGGQNFSGGQRQRLEIARALSMDTERIELAPEIARKLSRLDLLRRLIQKGNMQLRRVLLEGDWYKKDSGVYCGEHVVDETTGRTELAVMVPGRPGTYRMVTQACPTGLIIDDELAATILPTAFACYAGFPARALKLMDLLKFMVRSCWRGDYQTILLVSFFAGLIPLVTPIITETIFQDIIPIQDRQGLATVVQVMMVTSFTTAALGIVRQVALLRITTHIDMGAEAALWGRMLALPTSFFRRFQSGELASRMSGLESVKSLVSGEMVRSIFDVVFSVWSLVLMCYYSIQLTGAAIAVWLVYVAISVFIYRRVIGFQREAVKAHNAQAGIVQQIFAGLSKFRVQGAEAQAYYLWSRAFGESWRWNLKLRWQENYNTIIAAVQPFVLTMLLYYITVYVLTTTNADGTVTQGIGYAQFIAFSAAYSSFNSMLNSLIPLVGQYFAIKPQLENLAPILTEAPESTDDRQDAPVLSGAIEVSHLAFSYPGAEREVLHDVNLKIKAGETIAIVGRSGSGKSTLVRLLLGFETPKQGAIYYDGQDLAETNLASIRSQMGVVLQNGQLMTSDIFTNIIGMSASLTMDDAWNAAEAAGVARDIAAMPMGMHTVISEESGNISGGQRQRILIARALVRKPAIVIFDEATSALDNRTQSIVMDSLARLQGTRIIVAHRLSTIRDVDRIIVVDGGGIAESGTYDELMERGGIFAQLARRQIA